MHDLVNGHRCEETSIRLLDPGIAHDGKMICLDAIYQHVRAS
jgi:hypothetical protein